jgi:hypothetical protein
MDRIVLAKRLESFSEVFADHTPFYRDLKAMSYVLNKMGNDKFKGILAQDIMPDIPQNPDEDENIESCMLGKGPGNAIMGTPPSTEPKVIVIKKEEEVPMTVEAGEKNNGMFWNKEASQEIVDNLLRDVVGMDKTVCCDTGRKLDKDQVPGGSHAGIPEKPKSLKPEQTPDIAKSIDSDMVKKSKGTVKKEAGDAKGPGIPDKDGKGPFGKTDKCPFNKDKKEEEEEKGNKKGPKGKMKGKKESGDIHEELAEKAEQKAEDKEDKAQKMSEKAEDILQKSNKMKDEAEEAEEKAEEKEEKVEDKEAVNNEPTSSFVEGIELMASMDEYELDANEAKELSKLFE